MGSCFTMLEVSASGCVRGDVVYSRLRGNVCRWWIHLCACGVHICMCDHVCVRVSIGWEGRRVFGCFRQMSVNICKWERVWCNWMGRRVHICVCVRACQCTGDHALLTVSPLCLSLLVGEMGLVSTHLPVCFKDLMRSCV